MSRVGAPSAGTPLEPFLAEVERVVAAIRSTPCWKPAADDERQPRDEFVAGCPPEGSCTGGDEPPAAVDAGATFVW